MHRKITFVLFIFLSAVIFAQQNPAFLIFGIIPSAGDERPYQIQVGAFRVQQNAERAFQRLAGASLNPVYEEFMGFTRVLVRGISAAHVPSYMERIKSIGFSEALIRVDTVTTPAAAVPSAVIVPEILPVSTAALPSGNLTEIAHRSVKIGGQNSLADLAHGRNVLYWRSSSPHMLSVDDYGRITGLMLGNAFVQINEYEYISVAVVPAEDFFVVPASMYAMLPPESRSVTSTANLSEYRTEPTFRLAYRWSNRGENRGASGSNGGIDILGRGTNYEWLWTTYYQGGWFYDLNGVKREMVNGYQRGANGVDLRVSPEFVYDKGVPYLQLRHILTNTGNFPVTGQRFGASADVMIHNNDYASLLLTPYGAYMADSSGDPSLELMFICLSGEGITPVDTLWLGTYMSGNHLNYIYADHRINVYSQDSAIGFSYQNIDLAPGEVKEFIVRFTLARSNE